jgi:hypothetical protein
MSMGRWNRSTAVGSTGPTLSLNKDRSYCDGGPRLVRTSQPYVTQMPWLHRMHRLRQLHCLSQQLHLRLRQAQLQLHNKTQVRHPLCNTKHQLHHHICMKARLRVVGLRSYNKRCMLNFNIDENVILSKSCFLLLLRFTQEGFPLGYSKETEGYTEGVKTTADASNSHPSLHHLGKRQDSCYTWLETSSSQDSNATNGTPFRLPNKE